MIGDELNLAKNSEFLKAKTNLDSIKDFLDIVSDNYFESCNFAHQKFLLNLYGCEGAIETLKSILILLNAGQFISSFSLLRKFRDELFFSIFVLYENKLHEENDSKETYTSIDLSNDDEILKSLQKYIENDSKFTKNNEIYVANDKWLNNKINKSITETNKIRRDYFSYSGYLSNVLKNKDIKLVYDRFFAKGKIIDLQENVDLSSQSKVLKIDISSMGVGTQSKQVILPKSKIDASIALEKRIIELLSDDENLNIYTLVQIINTKMDL